MMVVQDPKPGPRHIESAGLWTGIARRQDGETHAPPSRSQGGGRGTSTPRRLNEETTE